MRVSVVLLCGTDKISKTLKLKSESSNIHVEGLSPECQIDCITVLREIRCCVEVQVCMVSAKCA